MERRDERDARGWCRVSRHLLLFLINSRNGVKLITGACGEFKTKSLIRPAGAPRRREIRRCVGRTWSDTRDEARRRARELEKNYPGFRPAVSRCTTATTRAAR